MGYKGKNVTASFVGGRALFLFFLVKSQDPKGKMKFERTPDIPAIAGDGLAYGVVYLQTLDSNLEIWDSKRNFYSKPNFSAM
jgi:hypothetical protein